MASRFGFLIAVALAWGGAAQANVIWNLSNVTFTTGNCNFGCTLSNATGFFVTNNALTGLVNWDITVAGVTPLASDYHYFFGGAGQTGTYAAAHLPLPRVQVANFGANKFLILDLTSALTNAGGTIALSTASLACPGCGVLKTGSVTTVTVPEPATLALLGVGLAGLAASRRRRTK